MIHRIIQSQIEQDLFKGKVIILYGPRQAGKTTLVKAIQAAYDGYAAFFNCDEIDTQAKFTRRTATEMRTEFENAKLIILDEAQRVPDIGHALKLLVDTYPELQIIATGSSSFDLSDRLAEPLTGRHFAYQLFPLSEQELQDTFGRAETDRRLQERLRFGSYPEILTAETLSDKERLLRLVTSAYLFQDVLLFQKVKSADILLKLLRALALQVGQEVSNRELGQLVGIDTNTVARYLDILEKAFVLFRLPSWSRNLRKEIGKRNKVYFYDVGIRNALINNTGPLAERQDIGALWENYIISERLKLNVYNRRYRDLYFWRTYDQQEIDLIEHRGADLRGIEFKWQPNKTYRPPKIFLETYPGSTVECITRANYQSFVTES